LIHNRLGAVHTNTLCGVEVYFDLVDVPTETGNSHGAGNMSEHRGSTVPIAASLAEFTDKLIARRGVEQSNLLFGGQIGPATEALSARTNTIGVGDPAPAFSLPTAEAGTWRLADHLAHGKFSSLVVVFYRGTWCAYCNIYLRGLLEIQSQLSDANAVLIAVSPEAAPASADGAGAEGPRFPVLNRSWWQGCRTVRSHL
jgi:thiol-disulfide isomerase/thioredoxin